MFNNTFEQQVMNTFSAKQAELLASISSLLQKVSVSKTAVVVCCIYKVVCTCVCVYIYMYCIVGKFGDLACKSIIDRIAEGHN